MNPYVGLRPFERNDSLLFFGRNAQVESLLALFESSRFLAVVGSSGCGKSSLIRAGLVPALEAGFLVQDRDIWRVATMKPGNAPLKHLASAWMQIIDAGDDDSERLANRIDREGANALLDMIETANDTTDWNVLLLVDQFEELFRFGLSDVSVSQRSEAETFVSVLLRLAEQRRFPVYICMTMRSDFLGDCDVFIGLPEAINQGQYLVPRLTRVQRREAIEGPARLARGEVTSRFVDRLLNENVDTRDDLPILQHLLMRVWDNWSDDGSRGVIDLHHYESVHTIHAALHEDAEAALKGLSSDDHEIARQLFQTVTEVDAGNRRIRRPATLSEISAIADAPINRVMGVIERFRIDGRHLLVLSSLDPNDDPVVDISHESLIRQWKTLKQWVDEEAESAAQFKELAHAAERYFTPKPTIGLFRDPQLQIALDWKARVKPTARWADRYSPSFVLSMKFLQESKDMQTKINKEEHEHFEFQTWQSKLKNQAETWQRESNREKKNALLLRGPLLAESIEKQIRFAHFKGDSVVTALIDASIAVEKAEEKAKERELWRQWGPYLSERAWGTVREDYSPNGTVWEYFDHDQARSRAYRWSEDGLAGISDKNQYLCFALALWNGQDPMLKERAFGVTGNQGNHGEDVKEYYFYRDATPSHSYLNYLYKYPQLEYPYDRLVTENRNRNRLDPPFNLLDSGTMDDQRHWDIDVHYAKATPTEIHIHVYAKNYGADTTTIDLIPTLWFRNTWSWGDDGEERPSIKMLEPCETNGWCVKASHPLLGVYYLYGAQNAECLFTENESNNQRLWGAPNAGPYVKDAFHRRVIADDTAAVNLLGKGTKFGAWSRWSVKAGQSIRIDLVLTQERKGNPFENSESVFAKRRFEADRLYAEILPEASPVDAGIFRQALSGMIWNKQFFHYEVDRWLNGDHNPAPPSRKFGRNRNWRHFKAHDILSMPDKWEYPWFSTWDLAYHCIAFAQIDIDFAKQQLLTIVSERFMRPNGQIPAYEWSFDDVYPPIHSMAVLEVFRVERLQRGEVDLDFLQRAFNKLLINFAYWINRSDHLGRSLFEGGFMGLENISAYDRSRALPPGYSVMHPDGLGWIAMFALNMTTMALELCEKDSGFEDVAIQCYLQFMSIAEDIAGEGVEGMPSLWDINAGFYKDVLKAPDKSIYYFDVYSWVGLIPLFATEVIDNRLLANAPRFSDMLRESKGGVFRGRYVTACPVWENDKGEHLLALVDHSKLPRILERLLDEEQFLSPYGIRSISKLHETVWDLGDIPGIGNAGIQYEPGESRSGMFGGNSNWRGPVWMPTNYSLIQAIDKFHRFLGDEFKVTVPCLDNEHLNLKEIADLLAERLVNLYRPGDDGVLPAMRHISPALSDEAWHDLILFYEYFHGETGQGLGAAHQTGWTGLLANLLVRLYQKDI